MNITEARPNVPLTEQAWREHVRNWCRGKLSQHKYCEAHGLNYHTFIYWRTKLKLRKYPQKTKAIKRKRILFQQLPRDRQSKIR